MTTAPRGLRRGGSDLWRAISEQHDLDAAQQAQLLEACRAKDRCDQLDMLLRGEIDAWATVELVGDGLTLRIDAALSKANETANLMKQLLAALRLPDAATGKRPQVRSARGAYAPTAAKSPVSSLERARARKAGA